MTIDDRNGTAHQIEAIIFFDPTTAEIVYLTGSGWLESMAARNTGRGDVVEFDVPGDVIPARKIDLTRREAFTIRGRRTYNFDHSDALYIPTVAGVSVERGTEVMEWENAAERHYATPYTVTLPGTVVEAYSLRPGHAAAEGSEAYAYLPQVRESITVWSDYRTERTEFGAEIDAIAVDLKAERIDLTGFTLEQVFTRYNMTRRSL